MPLFQIPSPTTPPRKPLNNQRIRLKGEGYISCLTGIEALARHFYRVGGQAWASTGTVPSDGAVSGDAQPGRPVRMGARMRNRLDSWEERS